MRNIERALIISLCLVVMLSSCKSKDKGDRDSSDLEENVPKVISSETMKPVYTASPSEVNTLSGIIKSSTDVYSQVESGIESKLGLSEYINNIKESWGVISNEQVVCILSMQDTSKIDEVCSKISQEYGDSYIVSSKGSYIVVVSTKEKQALNNIMGKLRIESTENIATMAPVQDGAIKSEMVVVAEPTVQPVETKEVEIEHKESTGSTGSAGNVTGSTGGNKESAGISLGDGWY